MMVSSSISASMRGEVHAQIGAERRAADLEVHQLRALVEGRMHGLGGDDVAAMLRHCRASRATSRGRSASASTMLSVPPVVMKPCAPSGALNRSSAISTISSSMRLTDGKARRRAQRILGEILEEACAADLVDLVGRLEHVQRRATVLPVDVAALHVAHLREDVALRTAGSRQRHAFWHAVPSPVWLDRCREASTRLAGQRKQSNATPQDSPIGAISHPCQARRRQRPPHDHAAVSKRHAGPVRTGTSRVDEIRSRRRRRASRPTKPSTMTRRPSRIG